MKKYLLCAFFVCLITLAGCQENVPEASTPPATVPTVVTEPTALPTVPTETTPPETMPTVPAPPETTEPPREYVPQDPDTTEYPKENLPATLSYFSGMLYVNDNRADTLVDTLPEGYIYIGTNGYMGPNGTGLPTPTAPRWPLTTCNVSGQTEFYGSLEEPDYIYYALDGKYRRMIRAGLVENYWDDQEIDPDVPENYTELFFEGLLTADLSQNRYHCATYSDFDRPEDVDLWYLFYSGFDAERHNKLTEAEEKFLLSDGWNSDGIGPVSNAKRLPAWRIDADLRRFFGIGYYDVSGVGINRWQSYWSETGCHYVWRSDMIGTNLTVDEVVHDETNSIYTVTYTMEYWGTRVMRLQLAGDTFRVLSNKVKYPYQRQ